MAHSGIDEFYEVIRILLAKYFAEAEGRDRLPDMETCNRLLALHGSEVAFILDQITSLQSPPAIFGDVQRVIGNVSIGGQDFAALDLAFEQLTSRTYKSDKGQYFTPRHVVDLCIEAIDPMPGELICDPACGSGAFLKSAHSYSLERHGLAPRLYGFDYSHRACQVAQAVSLIATADSIEIKQLDSLRTPTRDLLAPEADTIESYMGPEFKGFDAIVTNPPFAGDISSENFTSNYEVAGLFPRRLERDVLFIERCIRLLKNGGRLAIVLPDNKVSSRHFSSLRQWLARQSLIRAVVSLHRFTFLPYTSQKAAVIFAIKQKASASAYPSDVLFFRSDKPGKTSNGTMVFKPGADINTPAYQALDHDLNEAAPRIKEALCIS